MAKKNNVRILLDKKDGTSTSHIDITGYLLQGSGIKIKRALHNKGKAVISTAQCTIKDSVGTLEDKKDLKDGSAFVKTLIDLSAQNEGPEDKRPIVRIVQAPEKKGEKLKVLFTGYLRLGFKIDIKGHYSTEATTLSLEFVSLLESLENIKTPAKMYHKQAGYSIVELMKAIVHNAALPAHITFDYANITDKNLIGSYEVESEEPVFDVLQDIAFAYGYVMVTKGDGTIDFKKWWVDANVTATSLNHGAIMGDVKFQQKEMRKVRVRVDYSSYKIVNDYLFLTKSENIGCKANDYTKTLMDGSQLDLELNDTDLNDGYKLLSVKDHYLKAWGAITGEYPNVANVTADKEWKVSVQNPVNKTLEARSKNSRAAYVPKDSKFSSRVVRDIDSKAYFDMSLANSTDEGRRLGATAVLKTENNGMWNSCTSASLRLELRGKAAMHTTKDNARVMSGEGRVKKISALSIDDKKHAERLAEEYKRAVEDGSYRMSFKSREAMPLGDVFTMNFTGLNFATKARVLKIEQMMSPDESVFNYTLEKIGDITASTKATQETFKNVILPKVREAKLATVDEAQRIATKAIDSKNFITMEEAQRLATKAVHKALMTNTKDGGIIPINVKVNNRQITVEVYSHGDDPSGLVKFHYTYLYSKDKVTWEIFKKSPHRIAIKTFDPFDTDSTTVYIRVTGYATYKENGVQKFVDAVSEVVETEIAKVGTKDLSTQENFKMDSLSVKKNLHIGTQDPTTGGGQGETIINSKEVKIGDTLIDINALEGGSGVTRSTSLIDIKFLKYKASWSKREEHQVVVYDGKLWLIGGNDGEDRNDIWSTTDCITWTEVAAHKKMPYKSDYADTENFFYSIKTDIPSFVAFKNKIYGVDVFVNSVYNSTDGLSWTCDTKNIDPRGTRYKSRATTHNGRIYVLGGWTTSTLNSSDDGITWRKESEELFKVDDGHRWGHLSAMISFKNKLWIFGGVSEKTKPQQIIRHNDIWSSVDGLTWTKEKDHAEWTARAGHVVVEHNNTLFLIGGRDDTARLNDVWSSTDGITWNLVTAQAAFPVRRTFQVAVFKGAMWILGGINDTQTSKTYYNDIWSSTDGKTWKDHQTPLRKKAAGLRVMRGKKQSSVLVWDEDAQGWQADGVDVVTKQGGWKAVVQLVDEKMNQAKQDVLNAAIPVGFIYVQFPWQKTPKNIWGGVELPINTYTVHKGDEVAILRQYPDKIGKEMIWLSISRKWPGCFFRTEGGHAEAFHNNKKQDWSSVSYTSSDTYAYNKKKGEIKAVWHWKNSSHFVTDLDYSTVTSYPPSGHYNANEIRPMNYAVRIWKRIA